MIVADRPHQLAVAALRILTYAVVTAFIGYIRAGNYFGLDGVLADRAPRGFRRWLMSGDPGGRARTAAGTAGAA